MSDTEARSAVACLEIEKALRFEQLMGFVHTYETPFRLFTWALDWAFGDELNDNEVSLADQMRLWERDELRNMHEEGLRPFTKWRTVPGTLEDRGLDLGRLYGEMRGMGHGWFMNIDQVEDQITEASHIFEKYWDCLTRLDEHPDFVSESPL
jgi:hypothetical protein